MRTRKQSFDSANGNLEQNKSHIKFTNHQNSIHKVQSLKKVQIRNQCSFKPQVNEIPFEIYPQKGSKTEISKKNIFERLMEDRGRTKQILMAQKNKQQAQKCEQICTFKPQINVNSKKIIEKQSSKAPAHERLYSQGISKIKSLQAVYNSDYRDSDKQNCTFQPNLGKRQNYKIINQEKMNLAPIYSRLAEIIKQKKQNMQKLQQDHLNQNIKDVPEINEKTNQIIEGKKDFKKNVLDRLMGHLKQKNQKIEKLAQQKNQEIQKQCTFKPAINYTSEGQTLEEDFLQRQRLEAEKLKQKLKEKIQYHKEHFWPQINPLSHLLIEPEREGETLQDQVNRLHIGTNCDKKQHISQLQQQIYRQCTFHPQINDFSRALKGKPHSHKCQCHQKQEVFKFQPQINQKSKLMIEQQKNKPPKQKISIVKQIKKEIQYKQMKQCTFRPKTLTKSYKNLINQTNLKAVRGFDSFIHKVEYIKNKKKQQQEYKQKVFNLEKGYKPRQFTKIQQFNLTEPDKKILKLQQEAEEQFRKKCPFKPAITIR